MNMLRKILRTIFSWKGTAFAVHITILGLRIRIHRGLWLRFFAPRPGKIVMTNNYSNTYGGNPKCIAEELLRRDQKHSIIWITASQQSPFFSSNGCLMQTVPLKSLCAIFHAATAQVYVAHGRSINLYQRGWRKKPGQVCIQTNGGTFGVAWGAAAVSSFPDEQKRLQWAETAWSEAKRYDYILSNSRDMEPLLRRAYWNQGSILTLGLPRNDIFFLPPDHLAELRSRAFSAIGAPANAKLLLYAPAYRPGCLLGAYCVNFPVLLQTLHTRFGGNWVVGVRLPSRAAGHFKNLYPSLGNIPQVAKQILDCSKYPDNYELAAIADVLLSDIDPLLFNFLLTGRPAFAFVPDMEALQAQNALWRPFAETPLVPATDHEELYAQIRNFHPEEYRTRVEEFLARIGAADDGNATIRAADLIEAILAGDTVTVDRSGS